MIRFRERLITIDFEKTTPLGQVSFRGKNEDEIRALSFAEMRSGTKIVIGLGNYPCKIFQVQKDRPLQEYLPGGESVKSSLFELQEQVKNYREELNWYKNVSIWGGLGVAIAVLGINIALATFLSSLYTSLESNFFSSYRELKDDIGKISQAVIRLEEATKGLQKPTASKSTALSPSPTQPSALQKNTSPNDGNKPSSK